MYGKSVVIGFTMGMVVLVAALGILLVDVSPISALCAAPQEEGAWVNYGADTRGITRINVRFQCQDQILNGKPYPPGSPYYLHLYGSCQPTDCDWGELGAERKSDQWLYTTIDHGFATRYIWVKVYTFDAREYLRVWIYSDYRNPDRQDYALDEWFVRQ